MIRSGLIRLGHDYLEMAETQAVVWAMLNACEEPQHPRAIVVEAKKMIEEA